MRTSGVWSIWRKFGDNGWERTNRCLPRSRLFGRESTADLFMCDCAAFRSVAKPGFDSLADVNAIHQVFPRWITW